MTDDLVTQPLSTAPAKDRASRGTASITRLGSWSDSWR